MEMSSQGLAATPAGWLGFMLKRKPAAVSFLPRFFRTRIPVTIKLAEHIAPSKLERGFSNVADTKKMEDTVERKKVKRAARKKAAPKAKRTTPRGANKKKVKKLTRGQSKR
jgi:hypothetical protein